MRYWKPNGNMIRKKRLNAIGSAQQHRAQVYILNYNC